MQQSAGLGSVVLFVVWKVSYNWTCAKNFSCCIYVLGCRLSLVRLCDIDFGITAVDDIATGITCAPFCFHIADTSFSSSWYLFCLSVIILARLCVFGTAVSIKMVIFVFLFIKVMSGRLKGIILSISMLRIQYSLKFSFSSTVIISSSIIFWWQCLPFLRQNNLDVAFSPLPSQGRFGVMAAMRSSLFCN